MRQKQQGIHNSEVIIDNVVKSKSSHHIRAQEEPPLRYLWARAFMSTRGCRRFLMGHQTFGSVLLRWPTNFENPFQSKSGCGISDPGPPVSLHHTAANQINCTQK